MKKSVLFVTSILFSAFVSAQNCEMMLPFKQGASITYKNYDEKQKLLGSHKQTYIKVASEGEKVVSTVKAEYFDKKGDPQNTSEYTLKCSNGVILMDMSKMMPSAAGNNEMMKGMEMKMTGDDMEYPSKFTVGETLKNGKMKMEMLNAGTTFSTTDFEIVNRKVEAKETITTPAGTFECYKISQEYKTETKMMMLPTPIKIGGKSIQWYNIEAGMVKSESYKDDKLTGVTVLEEIKK